MKNIFSKWWNRKWSDWKFKEYIYTYSNGELNIATECHALFTSISNDGIIRYKRKKVY